MALHGNESDDVTINTRMYAMINTQNSNVGPWPQTADDDEDDDDEDDDDD